MDFRVFDIDSRAEILSAFGLDADYITEQAKALSEEIAKMEKCEVTDGKR